MPDETKTWFESKIVRISAVVVALTIILGGTWKVVESADWRPVMMRELNTTRVEVVELRKLAENATRIGMIAQFQILYDKKIKCNCLTFDEQNQLCWLAIQLQYTSIAALGC